jgi:hypothetical protein
VLNLRPSSAVILLKELHRSSSMGYIHYRDIFKRDHRKGFCLVYKKSEWLPGAPRAWFVEGGPEGWTEDT